MTQVLENVLSASFHGSIVIAVVLVLRILLRRAPKKYICMLWLLAGLRLLMPIQVKTELSLQPQSMPVRLPLGETLGRLLPWLWIAIACGFALYSLISYLRLKSRVREAVRIRGGWESDRIDTAFILGFIRPKIYIPRGMTQRSRKYILEHERTHLDKGDHWIKMIGFVALALHWFNPLVWVAYICLCRDIEMACDERVVQFMELEERKGYSEALLSCSSSRVHFASPVAFGEISVKQRILSVLGYKKPGFWVSLLSVLAIGFVAVCLLTSPVVPEETPTAPPTTPAGETGYAAGLKEGEIAYVCEKAIEELLNRETYFICIDQTVTYPDEGGGYQTYRTENRRHGSNVLNLLVEDGEPWVGGNLVYEGQYAAFMGDSWAWQGEADTTGQEWLEGYSPKGNVVAYPEGTGIVSGDTVAFQMVWTANDPWPQTYTGLLYFTFHEDGTIAAIHREYTYVNEDGDEIQYDQHLQVMEETPEDTAAAIKAIADQVITEEELMQIRKEQETITEIPSNKTGYDLDFALGAGSKQWNFLEEKWHVRIAAEKATPTGATLVYTESGDGHASFTAEPTYWLEKLVEGSWVMVGDMATGETQDIDVSWTEGHTYAIDWTDAYGALDAGFYRIGRYHTVTMSSGESETLPCYAKFRLYDPNQDALLQQCRTAFDALLEKEDLHILSTTYRVELQRYEEEPCYFTTEVWRSGADYLLERKTYYVDRTKGMQGHTGSMWRSGRTYNLTWEGDDMTTPVSEWKLNTYMDEMNFTLWDIDYTWFDSRVEGVSQNGNEICIVETYEYNDDYEVIETTLTFNDAGEITGIHRALLPTRFCAEDDRVTDAIAVVFDTDPGEIGRVIDAQDLSSVHSFSWAEEEAAYPMAGDGVRTMNFHNTAPVSMDTPEEVIDRAMKECTLPADAGLEPGTNIMQAFYDEESDMWKVEFTASWDDRVYQAVYMDAMGITQRTVTVQREVEE